ncbi:MAG: SMP-30/gluconolactonase/LRE family protein [Herpetosiphonaceae bacterium]|nr:SMP-30/gluconolactonase/LRE family protein [Herpetosiphonaceae bacterium]
MALEIEGEELRPLVAEQVLERLATGARWAEGPIWVEAGDYLLFSDIPNNTIQRWDESNGISVFRNPSGFANGNTLDREGRLLSCEHQSRRVSRTEADGTIVAVASHYQGKRLNSPNDVVVKSDGSIYFTDPCYGQKPDEGDCGPSEVEWQGVYRVQPDGSELQLLIADLRAPNGLVFSPDESKLYVDDSEDKFVRVYDVQADGTVAHGRDVAREMGKHADGPGGPDGMKVDADGRLWATGAGGIWVFDPTGRKLGVLRMPEAVANLNWGGPKRSTLYLAASTSLYRVQLNVAGAARPGV